MQSYPNNDYEYLNNAYVGIMHIQTINKNFWYEKHCTSVQKVDILKKNELKTSTDTTDNVNDE